MKKRVFEAWDGSWRWTITLNDEDTGQLVLGLSEYPTEDEASRAADTFVETTIRGYDPGDMDR